MERLTTNKDVSEMRMCELAHNSCYAKNGKARYRDYELDIDARELTRKLLKDHVDGDDAFTDDEDFDECMIAYLQSGMDSINGLIALFYRNLWSMADLRERLKYYEDLEEQGKLLKLPCSVGDTVYVIPSKTNYKLNIINEYRENNRIYEQIVNRIEISGTGYLLVTCDGMASVTDMFYKETWFLTREEAEAALEEMERGKGK